MAPLTLTPGTLGYVMAFLAIGFGFGFVLELAGFGDTRKLAAQFYFKDLTVLKVMFTGIVTAAVLIAAATSLGLLDMSRVWVNPTYLWPGIVGGLVMGVGFILGGFCPGTSVVAASTLKIDGMLFLLGVLVGVGAFGETVGLYEPFYLSSFMGRFTLQEWLGLPLGITLVGVVAMALFMFWGGELLEQRYGQGKPWAEIRLAPRVSGKAAAAAALLVAALAVAAHGQPTPQQVFARLGPAPRQAVESRGIFVDPAEVVALRQDLTVQVNVLDLRDAHAFDLFHVGGARRVSPEALLAPATVKGLLDQPASTVTFLIGTGEAAALEAWKGLKGLGVTNVYVVEGGINGWLERYPVPACVATPAAQALATDGSDVPRLQFAYATGDQLPAAWPELPRSSAFRAPCGEPIAQGGHEGIVWPAHPFTKKVKLQTRTVVKGGCG